MADYAFTTIWRLDAPIAAIWTAITEVECWPQWWRGVEAVDRLRDGDASGVGARYRYTWKSNLPYRLVFEMETTHVETYRRLEGAAQGELQGVGRWSFAEENGVATVHYDWSVQTARAWMNLLAPVARPLFAWNHDIVMAWGGEGLVHWLGAHLLTNAAGITQHEQNLSNN